MNFDDLREDYKVSAEALINSGVDLIMVETVFDTLNAKAALMAIKDVEENVKVPLMISSTITDLSGRTLSGQTLEGFYNSTAFGTTKCWFKLCFGTKRVRTISN